MRFVSFKKICLGGYLGCPPVDGPKGPWPRVFSLPERFVGDPASLARDNINSLSTCGRTKGSLAPCLLAARVVCWRPRLAGTRQY